MTQTFGPDTPLTAYETFGGRAEFNKGTKMGVHVKFENGWTVSIQYGAGTYSSNHDEWRDITNPEFSRPAVTAEVACWFDDPTGEPHSEMCEWADGEAEVACWFDDPTGEPHSEMCEWADGDTVQGYKDWDEVQTLLKAAAMGELTEPIDLFAGSDE
jgi:hypothetical protein